MSFSLGRFFGFLGLVFFCGTEIVLERIDLKIKCSLDVMASALLILRQN